MTETVAGEGAPLLSDDANPAMVAAADGTATLNGGIMETPTS